MTAFEGRSYWSLLRECFSRALAALTPRNLLIIILALALWWRLVYVTELPGQSIPDLQPLYAIQGDSVSYDSIATNLLEGNGYLNSEGEVPVLPPVYPTFLAAVYELSAHSFATVRIAQAIIGAATCGVIYLIGRRVFNPFVGLLAAAIAAAYPWFIYWNRLLSTETLLIFLLSLAILAMVWAVEKPVWRNLALAGFLLGIANLTHSTLTLLPFLFAGWLVVVLGLRTGTRAAAMLLAVFFLTLAPWTLRNYIHYGELIPIAAHGGVALYVANNPYAIPDQPHYAKLPDVDPADMRGVEGKSFLEKDRILRNKAIDYILEHPRTTMSNAVHRIRELWESVPAYPVFNMPLIRSEYYRLQMDHAVLLMFAIGSVAALAQWRRTGVLLLVPLQFALLHAFFPVVLYGRSRVPAMEVSVILAAFAVYAAVNVMASAPRWMYAMRNGLKERSFKTTWAAFRAGRRS